MHPTAFGVEQAPRWQRDTSTSFGVGLIEYMQQAFGKRYGQLRLTLGFLGIEGQLQHPAIVPVDAPLQML
ncbi:hypothetical protein D3C85_1508310 [compost metagenome]